MRPESEQAVDHKKVAAEKRLEVYRELAKQAYRGAASGLHPQLDCDLVHKAYEEFAVKNAAIVFALQDVLLVNFVTPTDDVKADLHKLVGHEIQMHTDPRVSSAARERMNKLFRLGDIVAAGTSPEYHREAQRLVSELILEMMH